MWDFYRGNWIFIPMPPVERGPSTRFGTVAVTATPWRGRIGFARRGGMFGRPDQGRSIRALRINARSASPTTTVIKMRMGFQERCGAAAPLSLIDTCREDIKCPGTVTPRLNHDFPACAMAAERDRRQFAATEETVMGCPQSTPIRSRLRPFSIDGGCANQHRQHPLWLDDENTT
jgi:hypothetical protein